MTRSVWVRVLICISLAHGTHAQRVQRDAVVGRFLSGLTGASLAEDTFGNQCYYQDGPPYLFIYPGAPIYAYDYPTYLYSPIYAYPNMRHAIYPSYFFYR